MDTVKDLDKKLEQEANTYRSTQKDANRNQQMRQQYQTQLGENEMVLKELELLGEDANVYKLIGPVLVKQDLVEAKANVKKRIDYISAETRRLDSSLHSLEEKLQTARGGIMKLQQQRAQAMAAATAKQK